MKRTMLMMLVMLCAISINAQPYVLCDNGAKAIYKLYTGESKWMGLYVQYNVTDVKTVDNKTIVTTLVTTLNKKKEPTSQYMVGKGCYFNTELEGGSFYLAQDPYYGLGQVLERTGYIVRIPDSLYVGYKFDCSTINSLAKVPLLGKKKIDLNYSNFQVVAEEDVTVPAGTFHCFKVTGNITGKFWGRKTNDSPTWWLAPGVGFVKYVSTADGNYKYELEDLIK